MSLIDLVQRLLTKRCASFVGADDSYKLLSGETGNGDDYTNIGSELEKPPLVLQNVISYDEIKLSAFLSISSYSEFLNNGNLNNAGLIAKDLSQIEREGLIVGIIGARFQKPFFMEYQDIVISPEQNLKENGYGYSLEDDIPQEAIEDSKLVRLIEYRKLWQKFYDHKDFLFDDAIEIEDSPRFTCSTFYAQDIVDCVMMKKRYALTLDTLLLESQSRAEKLQKHAYIHVEGIGLGAWCETTDQEEIFLECMIERVKHLLPILNNIGVLSFSWGDSKYNDFIKSETHPLGGIKTLLEKRNPADKLKEAEFENMFLVVTYAGDGNALPGNEFWCGNLPDNTGDPCTAWSTLISELHNAHINTDYMNGDNLHIASMEYGSMHVSDYVKKMSLGNGNNKNNN